MPFQTDQQWTPSTYRAALNAWDVNNPETDSEILPRQAKSVSPRHAGMSKQLRNLLTWRAIQRGDDWTSIASNDNQLGCRAPVASNHEIQPSEGELLKALEGVDLEERRHARLGGNGDVNIVAVGGDMERGKVQGQRKRRVYPDCVTRLGRVTFSGGAHREPALVRDSAGKIVRGSVRIPLGGMIKVGRTKAGDRFVANNDNNFGVTVGNSLTSSMGRMEYVDPVAEASEAAFVRTAVGAENATILDLAIRAANFGEIGRHFGYAGKRAERKGKAAVIGACAVLDEVFAA